MSSEDSEKMLAALRGDRPNTFLVEIKPGERDIGALTKSYADHGLAWVEVLVNQCIPDAKIFPPMLASGFYGEYFHEFDIWRSAKNYYELMSFQGVLIETARFQTASLRIANKDSMTSWYGKQFRGQTVALLIIDRALVTELSRSLYHLLVAAALPIQTAQHWGGIAAGSYEPSPLSLDAMHHAREAFRNDAESLKFFFGPSAATRTLEDFMSNLTPTEVDQKWMWSYCESMSLHFLIGHEFGHYAFKAASEPTFEGIAALADLLLTDHPNLPASAREEVFCDLIGIENCLFQMEQFEVPPVFTVYGPIWALCLIREVMLRNNATDAGGSALADTLQLRAETLGRYWSKRNNLTNHPAFGKAAQRACGVLPPLAASIGQFLGQ